MCVRVQSISCDLTPHDPMDCVARQAPLSMESYRQEHWKGLSFPSPEYIDIIFIYLNIL